MPKTTPHILILTASAGAGHLVAAAALQEALIEQAPEARAEVLDVLTLTNRLFRKIYADGYLALVRHAPAMMGALYESTDAAPSGPGEALRLAIQNASRGPVVRRILSERPDLIISTHFLPGEIAAQMQRCGKLSCPLAVATTDFETHRLWGQPPTRRYYTATAEGAAFLQSWGIPADRILAAGIPVRRAFRAPLDRAALRRAAGIEAEASVVLVLCGGFGVGPIGELLRYLVAMEARADIVVIAGRNERLRQRLERLAAASPRPVRVVGFTDRMHEWMHVADLVVTKPGGLTACEALACGLPMVIVNPIPGQETRNSDYLLENGAAIKVNNARLLGYRVSSLLHDSERLAELRARAAALSRPKAAEEIAADALSLIP